MIDGLVVVDKSAGWTSHDVVARCRRLFGQRRVGHSGTLDPGATGVLLVGLGRVTRLLRYLTELSKTYTGEVVLGVATSTLDDGGETLERFDMSGVGLHDARRAAAALTGPILQVPPMVSAVQIGGQRLYKLAREGIEVERAPRPVTVHSFDIAEGSEPGVLAIRVSCSSGTYIRALAADLGTALGGGAHLRRLRRTAIGSFDVEEARTLEALEVLATDLEAAVLAPAEALRDYASARVSEEVAALVGHGRRLDRGLSAIDGSGPWAILAPDGALLAVYEADETDEGGAGGLRPVVVMTGR